MPDEKIPITINFSDSLSDLAGYTCDYGINPHFDTILSILAQGHSVRLKPTILDGKVISLALDVSTIKKEIEI